MNRNTYLNVIVTLFLLLFLALGCVIITALDRHRYALENLSADLKRLESRLTSGIPAAAEKTARAAVNAGTEVQGTAANAEYFDPAAVSGGRLVRAFQADVGNMNKLITNDAYVSQIWAQVTDSLAERDYNDRGDGEFKPMLAESWTISPDRRKVRVRLRKGILWHDFKDPVTGKEWKNREVTAQDVKFYVDVIKNPAVDCAPLRVYYNDL